MRGSALGEVYPGLLKAELSVHSQAHLQGIAILLAIVFPPAHWTQPHRTREFERFKSAARTLVAACDGFHACVDGIWEAGFTRETAMYKGWGERGGYP